MDIDKNKILAWDIETIPMENFSEDTPFFDTWSNRNRKDDLTSEELIEKFNNEGGLYGEYLKIVCISCAYYHNDEFRLASFVGDEKDIIDNFLNVAKFVFNNSGGVINLGHNVQNYDIPVLRKVYSRYYPMFTLPDYVSDLNTKGVLPVAEKPWILSERILDTLQIQKGGNYMFSSMAEVALNLGLESPKVDTDGSKVSQMFREGRIKEITDYCEGDVTTSLKILFKWMGEDLPNIVKPSQKVVAEEKPLLEKLMTLGTFTTEIQEEVKNLTSKKKLTKTDKRNIEEILLSVYQQKGDKKADKQRKEKEIANFVKEL